MPARDPNTLFVGGEDGSICQVQIRCMKPGIVESLDAHDGFVTSVNTHPMSADTDWKFSDLMLSTSMDWSAKLWNQQRSNLPLQSFEACEDCVYDAKWHTNHPGVFVVADGDGYIDVWNLNKDVEAPIARLENPGGTDTARPAPVNRVAWHADGRHLLTGDAAGKVHFYDVDKEVAFPAAEEFKKLEDRVAHMDPLAADREPVDRYGRFGYGY